MGISLRARAVGAALVLLGLFAITAPSVTAYTVIVAKTAYASGTTATTERFFATGCSGEVFADAYRDYGSITKTSGTLCDEVAVRHYWVSGPSGGYTSWKKAASYARTAATGHLAFAQGEGRNT